MKRKLLLLFSLLFCAFLSYGQKGLSLHAGLGIAELPHIGIRYFKKPMTFGATIGVIPFGDKKTLSGSLSTYFHFGGQPKFMDRRPWFVRLSLTSLRSDSEYMTEHTMLAGLRFGREVKLNNHFGMNFDLGIEYPIANSMRFKKPAPNSIYHIIIPVPGFSITCFYQF